MHNIYQIYLDQVRAALWQQPVVWPQEHTEALLRLHMMQGTGPLVFPSVLEQQTLSSYARAQMKGACMHTMQQHIPLHFTLAKAWTALVNAGLQPVLMKGASLAAFYPEPHYRTWGDVDLYVGADQYHPACAVMRETFPNALKFEEELDHYKHYNLIADGVSIEIHRVTVGLQHPRDERLYARMEREGMQHAVPLNINGLEVKVPEPTFNALLIFLHSWEHMMTQGANMRQLCDLALLLHHYARQIDKSRLKRYLKALHLMDVWYLYANTLVYCLGLPADEMLFTSEKVAARSERLMEDLLGGKLVEPKVAETAPKGRIARKFHTMVERNGNAKRIAQYSPAYGRHMVMTTLLHGAKRFFAKDRHWE